jgi:sugar/nucleoside kinase (ribokinase family)
MTAPRRVLVVGDANVDLVLRGDVVPRFGQVEQLLDDAQVVLGGSASIVASGLARLGVPTSLVAVVGDDDFGRFAVGALASAGVDVRAVRVDARTPTGISVILSAPHDRAILTLAGTIPMLTSADVLAAVELSGATLVHFASPFLMPAFTATLPALLSTLSERGIGTSLDTNWDPAGEWAGLGAVLPAIDVLLPNRAELDAITRVIGPLTSRVVVKDGAEGGWSQRGDDAPVRAPGLRVDVVDTTGAGDSFDAGYLAALAYGVEEEGTRVRWAAIAGSLSTRGAGGTAAQATLQALREYLDEE